MEGDSLLDGSFDGLFEGEHAGDARLCDEHVGDGTTEDDDEMKAFFDDWNNDVPIGEKEPALPAKRELVEPVSASRPRKVTVSSSQRAAPTPSVIAPVRLVKKEADASSPDSVPAPACASLGSPTMEEHCGKGKAVVFDDVDEHELGLPGDGLSPFSLDAIFPKGSPLYLALRRTRGTLNERVLDLAIIDWVLRARTPSFISHLGRIKAHSHEVIGKVDPDIELGFRDMVTRLHSLIELHKKLKTWIDNKDPSLLVHVVRLLNFFQRFLENRGRTLAPDLSIVRFHGMFQVVVDKGEPVSELLQTLDIEEFIRTREELVSEMCNPDAVHVDKDEDDDDSDGEMPALTDVDMELDKGLSLPAPRKKGAGKGAAKAKAQKKKDKLQHLIRVQLSAYLQMQDDALNQLSAMCCNAIKVQLSKCSAEPFKMEVLESMVDEYKRVLAIWRARVTPLLPGEARFPMLLQGHPP